MTRIRWYGPSLVLLITIIAVLVAGPLAVRQIAFAQTEAKVRFVQNTIANNEALQQLSESFRNVATVVEPSVVHVEVLGRPGQMMPGGLDGPGGPGGPGQGNPFEGTPFEDWFRQQMPEGQGRGGRGQGEGEGNGGGGGGGEFDRYNRAVPRGNGSGWVYDRSGHIITNNHVVENAEEIKVRFQNGAEYVAEVVGTDPSTDVAVLKVEATDLIPLIPSDQAVQPGEIVFAFGSPFGFDFSMSQGIVSAKGRKLHIISGGYENFIQTDAAINPGNSGGPLTDITGKVVGVNTAIASRTGANNGLGFAIPITIVTQIADQIISTGKVSRGYLGVFIEDLDPKMGRTFGFEGKGVLVVGATPGGSPATDAGIESGDIISHVNGQAVETADDLRFRVAGLAPGTEVPVTIFRNGETLEKTVTLGELPTQGLASAAPTEGRREQAEQPTSAGMQTLQKWGVMNVETFTRDQAERADVPFREGVAIRGVRRGSVAEGEGLMAGPRVPAILITDVQGEAVETVEQLVEQMEKHDAAEGVRLRLAVWNPQTRAWTPRFVLLELPKD